jgi:phosphoglycolate phosphatase
VTRAVVFDLDGTLVDTSSAIVDTFTAVFASMQLPCADPVAIRATIGLPLEQSFSRIMNLPLDDERVTWAARCYVPLFREHVLPRARELVFPGVAEGIAALSARGFALAIATSKYRASAEALLCAAGLRDQLALVVGADSVVRPKPHPEMLRHVMRGLAVPACRMVMVGDTSHDLLMARAAGVRSIAVTYGVQSRRELVAAEPTCIAESFDHVVYQILADDLPAAMDPTLPC